MKRNPRHRGRPRNGILGRLAAEKKKSITALCLVAIMALMWIRVLIKGSPGKAEGSPAAGGTVVDTEPTEKVKVSFIELPEVTGRNDVITRDFFACDRWQEFRIDADSKKPVGNGEVSSITEDGIEETIGRVAKEMELQVVESGDNPHVQINDRLLSVGGILPVSYGGKKYEFEVVRIEGEEVQMRYEGIDVVLRLAQPAGETG